MNDRIVYTFSHMWVCYRTERGLFSMFVWVCVPPPPMMILWTVCIRLWFYRWWWQARCKLLVLRLPILLFNFSFIRVLLLLRVVDNRWGAQHNNAIDCNKTTVRIFNGLKTFFMQSQSWNNCVVNNVIKITNDRALTHSHKKRTAWWAVLLCHSRWFAA